MGWGYTNQNKFGISNDLLEVTVTTLTNKKCIEGVPMIGETKICAFAEAKKGVCGVRQDRNFVLLWETTNFSVINRP